MIINMVGGAGGSDDTFAMITINYPVGSTFTQATNTDGYDNVSTTQRVYYVKSPTSGTTQACEFTITDGTQTKTQTVSDITVGTARTITLQYSVYLYNMGDECSSITGGWDNNGWTWNGNTSVVTAITKNADNMYSIGIFGSKVGIIPTVNKINMTEYSSVHVVYTSTLASGSSSCFCIGINKQGDVTNSTASPITYIHFEVGTEITSVLPIPNGTTECYFFASCNDNDNLTIYQVWLE